MKEMISRSMSKKGYQESKHPILSIENTIEESKKMDTLENENINIDDLRSDQNANSPEARVTQESLLNDMMGGSVSRLDIMQQVNSDYIKSNLQDSNDGMGSQDGNILHKIKAQSDIYCNSYW